MIQGRYGVALTFAAPIVKAGGDDFAASADWTPAAGDVKVSKDRGSGANITTLPSIVTSINTWSWPLSATEMEALEVEIVVVDAATKAVKDQAFRITTLPHGALYTGKASAGGANTITVPTGLNIKAGQVLEIHGGTGAGQALVVNSYVSGTGVVTMENNWGTQPDSTSLYTIWPGPVAPATTVPAVDVTKWNGTAVATPDTAGHPKVTVKSGTGTGEVNLSGGNLAGSVASVTGAVGSVTGAVGSVTGAVGSVTGNVGGNVVGSVASVTGNVGGNVVGSVGSLATQAKADVNAEVNDVLNVDASAEPSAVPAANASLGAKLRWLFLKARNKATQTATTQTLLADDGTTPVATSTVSDDGTTATRGKFA